VPRELPFLVNSSVPWQIESSSGKSKVADGEEEGGTYWEDDELGAGGRGSLDAGARVGDVGVLSGVTCSWHSAILYCTGDMVRVRLRRWEEESGSLPLFSDSLSA
jgi:hypothetical protein